MNAWNLDVLRLAARRLGLVALEMGHRVVDPFFVLVRRDAEVDQLLDIEVFVFELIVERDLDVLGKLIGLAEVGLEMFFLS